MGTKDKNLEVFYSELLQILSFISSIVLFTNYYEELFVLIFVQNKTIAENIHQWKAKHSGVTFLVYVKRFSEIFTLRDNFV